MILRIYSPQHKVVWIRRRPEVGSIEALKWSRDRRYLAIIERCVDSDANLRMVIWNIKGTVLQIEKPLDLFHDEDDAVEILWSPDDRRLLLRTVSSGDLAADCSTVWCLNMATGQVQRLPDAHHIRRAEWVGPKRVRYWVMAYPPRSVKDPRGKAQHVDGLMFAEASRSRTGPAAEKWVHSEPGCLKEDIACSVMNKMNRELNKGGRRHVAIGISFRMLVAF